VGADPKTAERAATLAKADLVTGMVNEFPELQGVMGRYYALEQGESSEIANAIRDHYKPKGQDDASPTAPVSVAVALGDKIDTLTAFYSIDKKPTGSSDPFALRRAALGVASIILGANVGLALKAIFAFALSGLIHALPKDRTQLLVEFELLTFVHDRLKVYLKDKGHRHDAIDAVRFGADGSLQDDLVLIVNKLKALEAFLKTDDGINLAAAYKRAANILKAEEKKDGAAADANGVKASLLKESQEKLLFARLADAEAKVEKAVAAEDFEAAMTALASLRAPLDAFFEKVTVNADDADIRANRLSLLARLRAATSRVADFSKLEG
jgi:glycyl-tRNA synthetase beta chain